MWRGSGRKVFFIKLSPRAPKLHAQHAPAHNYAATHRPHHPRTPPSFSLFEYILILNFIYY